MSEQIRPDINCPSCGSAIDGGERSAVISCSVCNGQFALAGHLCPACSTYHEEDQAACDECGNPLVRLYKNCHTINWTGDEECIDCGQSIDLLGQVESASKQSDADRLDRQMNEAKALKETEAAASDKRMAELMAIEEARQAELMLQRSRRQRHERRMLIIVFAAVLLFLLGMIGYSLLSGS